jgi:hypothetical protein
MTIEVSPTRQSVRQVVGLQLRDAIKHVNDRVVLIAFFILAFYFYYWADLLHGFASLFSVESDVTVSRTLGGAEILGLVAVAVTLKDLKSDRVLRWWDFAAIIATAIAGIYSSRTFGAIGVTCLGVLFMARSDKRIASLGQLCVGFAWLGFWGPLALDLIKPWLLPIETALAYAPLSFLGSFSLHGTIISNGNGFAIQVYDGCSAFHNTITTAFIWLSLMKMQRLDVQPKHVGILAIGLVAVILLNTARIGVMAVSMSEYTFWHYGPGLVIIKIMMLSGVLGLFYFGLRPAKMSQLA